MSNSMKFFKRLTAFLLALLLFTSMVGDDFSAFAGEGGVDEYASDQPEELIEEESLDLPDDIPEPVVEDVPEEDPEPEPIVDKPVDEPIDPPVDDIEIPTTPDEVVTNDAVEKETPEIIDEENGEEVDEEELEEEEECEHKWAYISHGDGTHTKKCELCDEESDEACTYGENGKCIYCGYQEIRLEQQVFERTVGGVTVTVSGLMPKDAKVTIFSKPVRNANEIVNDNLSEGSFCALAVFDITIYDGNGNKYQPSDDNNSVSVTFKHVEGLNEFDDSEIAVYRIEEDKTVTEIDNQVIGEDVTFEAEHFTEYAVGTSSEYTSFVKLSSYQNIAYIATGEANYTKVNGATINIRVEEAADIKFDLFYYKNLKSNNPEDGTLVATKTVIAESPNGGLYEVPITFDSLSDEAFVIKGQKYSVVVKANRTCEYGYGKGTLTQTYLKDASLAWSAASYPGIIQPNETTSAKTTDSYTIASVTGASQADASGTYHYAKGDKDTFTATLSNPSAERSVTWTSSNTSVATIDSTTGELTAVGPGTATISATYEAAITDTKPVNISVLNFKLEGDELLAKNPSEATKELTYTGTKLNPGLTIEPSATNVTYSWLGDDKVGTAKATIVCTPDSNHSYTYERYIKIVPINITGTTAFNSAKFTVLGDSVTNITDIGAISGVTPAWNDGNGDITAEIRSSRGNQYTIRVTGKGNFTGYVDVNTTIEGVDINSVLSVELSSTSRFKNIFYTGVPTQLTPSENGWSEVVFKDKSEQEIDDIVNATTANYTITDAAGTKYVDTSDATFKNKAFPAGTMTITFTMKTGGYTSSLSTTFKVQQEYMSRATVEWKGGAGEAKNEYKHTGEDIILVPGTDFDVKLGTVTIDPSDYELSYPTDHKNIGTRAIEITGAGKNFTNDTSISSSFKIVADFGIDAIIRINDNGTYFDGDKAHSYATGYSKQFDNSRNAPSVIVYLQGKGGLAAGTDYQIDIFDDEACTKNINNTDPSVGTKYIKIHPINNYAGYKDLKGTYTVTERSLTSSIIKVTKGPYGTGIPNKKFIGKDVSLNIANTTSDAADLKLMYGTTTLLIKDKDFTVSYSNNYNVGTATYILEGKGNYTGRLTGTFEIEKAKLTIKNEDIQSGVAQALATYVADSYVPTYDGTPKTPTPLVMIRNDGSDTTVLQNDPKNNNSANYTFDIDNNINPGNGTITIVGHNNLEGTVIVPFVISSTTVQYSSISLEGAPANYQSGKDIVSTDANGKRIITRIYTSEANIPYTGRTYTGEPVIYGIDTTRALERGKDFECDYTSAKNAATYNRNLTDMATSPCITITGLGKYYGNNAKIYFDIQPLDINEVTINGVDDSYAFTTGVVQKPAAVTLTYKGTTVSTSDYDIYILDSYDAANNDTYSADTVTAKAGEKTVFIRGKNNYSGVKIKKYSVGTDISKAPVIIQSYYYNETTNPDASEIWYNGVANTSSAEEPFTVYWRGSSVENSEIAYGKAPKVSLQGVDAANYTHTADANEISKLGLVGNQKYNARKTLSETDTNYNVITWTATGKESLGYYGTATIYYCINPQDISTAGARMTVDSTMVQDMPYTGTDQIINPKLKFTYGSKAEGTTEVYSLVAGSDFTPASANIGSNIGNGKTADIAGIGNFTGHQTLTFNITKGYVWIYKSMELEAPTKFKETDKDNINQTYTIEEPYLYDGKNHCPEITLRSSDGVTVLKSNEYQIIKPHQAVPAVDLSSVGTKTITVKVTGENYVNQTILINYEIKKNSIESCTAAMDPIEYACVNKIKAEDIANYINSNKAFLKVSSANTGVLQLGKDYEIVSDNPTQAVIDEIKAQEGGNWIDLLGANYTPSAANANWFYIHGLGTFSGYKKVNFDIKLNLNSDYAQVGIQKANYELYADGSTTEAILPVIKYKKAGDDQYTFSGTDLTSTDNYVLTRARDKQPGPDENITVSGRNLLFGTVNGVRFIDTDGTKKTVCFRISLQDYAALALASGDVPYTGNRVEVEFTGLTEIGATKHVSDAVQGDYTVLYRQTTVIEESAINVGKWYAIVKASPESKFFKPGTSKEFEFYIKYNLATATIELDSASYTGLPIPIPVYITSQNGAKGNIYNYNDPTTLVKFDKPTVTKTGPHTIVVSALDTTKVYGTKEFTFTIDGIDINNCNISVENGPFTYTGFSIEPAVTITHTLQSGASATIKTLTKDVDYEVSYNKNTDAGNAVITITGINGYSGSVTKNFTINPKKITKDMVTVDKAYYAGRGNEVKPGVVIVNKTGNQTHTLALTKDYEIAGYGNNASGAKLKTASDAPYVVIKAGSSGNYYVEEAEGLPVEFTIEKLDLRTANIAITPDKAEYTGSNQDEYTLISVKYNNQPLRSYATNNTDYDYKLSVKNGVGEIVPLNKVDTYTIWIEGDEKNTTGKISAPFEITPRSLANNYHYYYSAEETKFIGSFDYSKDLDATENGDQPGYITTGGLVVKDPTTLQILHQDTLTITIYDCTTVTPNVDNPPYRISIVDSGVKDPHDASKNYELVEGVDYEISLGNAKGAGSAVWKRKVTDDKHAEVADDSPYVTIIGKGNYSSDAKEAITIPYNIGKNINNLGLSIVYTTPNTDPALASYTYNKDADPLNTSGWSYVYNGVEQKPSKVTVKDANGNTLSVNNYTITYTDVNGNEDLSINAGYKYIVITGTGDYCGTISQRYQINKKPIKAKMVKTNNSVPEENYTTENPMKATNNGREDGTEILSFALEGNTLSRLTTNTAKKYLADTGVMTEAQASNFVGFYYAVYDRGKVEPSFTITDHTLGKNGTSSQVISKKDYEITYEHNGEVSSFTAASGNISSYTLAKANIKFKSSTNNTFSDAEPGNYYVPASTTDSPTYQTYTVEFIIVKQDISKDFAIQLVDDEGNELSGNNFDYNHGMPITPKVKVTDGTNVLTEGEDADYVVDYGDKNYLPGAHTITVTGKNNYIGTKTEPFYVWGNLADTKAYYKDDEENYVEGVETQQYTGQAITYGLPRIYLALPVENSVTTIEPLIAGADYAVEDVKDNEDGFLTGGKVKYKGLGYWAGSYTDYISYNVEFSEDKLDVDGLKSEYPYTGYPIKPEIKLNVSTARTGKVVFYRDYGTPEQVTLNDEDLTQFIEVGKITAVIPYELGEESGDIEKTYEITPRPISQCDVIYARSNRYTGLQIKPPVTVLIVSNDGVHTVDPSEYSVSYGPSLPGPFKITIAGVGKNISDTNVYTGMINIGAPVKVVAKADSNNIKVTWVHDIYSRGEEIQLLKQDGTPVGQIVTLDKIDLGSDYAEEYTFTGLEHVTTYKVRIRSYQMVNGDKKYSSSNWEDAKTVIVTTGISNSTLDLSSYEEGKATIVWDKDGDAVIYKIYRANDATSEGELVAVYPASTGAYTNSNLESGKTYYYYMVGYSLIDGKLTIINESEHKGVQIK